MAAKRPLASRKPTKDPADIADIEGEYTNYGELLAIARSDAMAVLTKDDKAGSAERISDSVSFKPVPKQERKKHKMYSDVKFTPSNTAFDRHNPEHKGSFHGFFALFWLGLAFLCLKTQLQHWRLTGNFFRGELATLYRLNAWDLAKTDAIMVSSSIFVVFLQFACHRGLSWNKFGWVIENVWQTYYLASVVHTSYHEDWQWIQSVFIVLHCCVMLMKQHSYASYMGYLSEIYKTRNKLEKKLIVLRRSKVDTPKVQIQPPSPVDEQSSLEASSDPARSTESDEETTLVDRIAELSEELTHDGVTYPENLTMWNYIDYLLVPSLVYDIVYPRTERIRWWYVFEKTLATLGTFAIMTLVVEHYILPVIPSNLAVMTTREKLVEIPWLMLDIVFPFLCMYLLTFYIIFECITNWFAEVTCFADRNFYEDWWNSLTWDDFARKWNVPVHRFLLRHVYHSSMSVLSVKKKEATSITFLLSSLVHEMVMACMTKKIRLYLLFSQMLQLPLIWFMRLPFFKRNPAAANVFFWFGLFCGPSFLCLAYVLF